MFLILLLCGLSGGGGGGGALTGEGNDGDADTVIDIPLQ